MTQLLLSTKLYMPTPPAQAVERERLLAQLDQIQQRKLTLISAPPGFGKTSLLAEWSNARQYPLGWFSLDESDNDPVRFWTYFFTAVAQVCPEPGKRTLALLNSASQALPPIDNILTEFLNEIATLPTSSGVVLDDYHVIKEQSIHQGLNFLLDHLPPCFHLFITSRADPLALPLSRMRVRGELVEIRAAQLRFTTEEVTSFFASQKGMSLPEQEIEKLATRTEGWVAGLQLAALSLQDFTPEDARHFINNFTGNDRYIVDYLMDEVLQHQPAEIRTFLMETSILDRLSGELCRAVTLQEDASKSLTYLEQRNLFVISLDNRRQWYRYHQLFCELLRHHLIQAYSLEKVNELYQRASLWAEQNRLPREAIRYALAGKAFDKAAELVEQVAGEMLTRAELQTLKGWLEAIPDTVVRTRPHLVISYAWVLLLTREPERATSYIEAAEQQASTDPFIAGNVAVMRAHLALRKGELSRVVELAERAFELIPEASGATSSLALILARTHLYTDEADAAEKAFQKAALFGRTVGNHYTTISGLVGLGRLQLERGNLRNAAQLCEEAIALGTNVNGETLDPPLPIAGEALGQLSEILLEWNRLDEAEEKLALAIKLNRVLANFRVEVNTHLTQVQMHMLRGEWQQAFATLDMLERYAENAHQPGFVVIANSHRTRVWLGQGKLKEATAWAQALPKERSIYHNMYTYWHEQITLVRVWLAMGEIEQGQKLLGSLQEKAQGWPGHLIEVQMLQALFWATTRDMTRATNVLAAALVLAEPEGYTRLFVNEGVAMLALLRRLKNNPLAPADYLQKLLDAFGEISEHEPETGINPPISPRPDTNRNPFIEIPSERELEVLRLIASGLSNQEIADKLIISPNTIKAHINKIYAKLDVNSRTQAILRARELNLL